MEFGGHYLFTVTEFNSFSFKIEFVLCRLFGRLPFEDSNVVRLNEKIRKGLVDLPEEWNQVSKLAQDFVLKLLNIDSEKRMTSAQAMEHPWINLKLHRHLSHAVLKRSSVNLRKYIVLKRFQVCFLISFFKTLKVLKTFSIFNYFLENYSSGCVL